MLNLFFSYFGLLLIISVLSIGQIDLPDNNPSISSIAVKLQESSSATEVNAFGLEIRTATTYTFLIIGISDTLFRKQLEFLNVTLPGDPKRQVIAYCEELRGELSVGLCYALQKFVMDSLPATPLHDTTMETMPPLERINCPHDGLDGSGPSARSRLNGCRRNGLKIAVVHLATEKAHWSATHAQAINLMYARRHGYDFISHSCPELGSQTNEEYLWDSFDQVRANWAKPRILLDHLQRYHLVLLLDSDAYISDPSVTIEEVSWRHFGTVNNDENKFSVVLPNNCFAKEKGNPDSWSCWSDGLNIAAILARNDSTASAQAVLEEWSKAVHIEAPIGCKDLVYPQWDKAWAANDQSCLDRLYKASPSFQKTVKVLSHKETYYFVGGADDAWITHLFGGHQNMNIIGEKIQKDALAALAQPVYESRVNRKKKIVWKKQVAMNLTCGGSCCIDGSCFDVSVIHPIWIRELSTAAAEEEEVKSMFGMYLSHRPSGTIAFTFSHNGYEWPFNISLAVDRRTSLDGRVYWDSVVNRPHVLYLDKKYHMWFTGQTLTTSAIGYAISANGLEWTRVQEAPVLEPHEPWEQLSIMCSHVLFDEQQGLFRMWYSAGEQYEPNAIGHAVSCDGINWNRTSANPIFTADKSAEWEKDRVTCPTVVYNGEYYYMFYIGFSNIDRASIGLARSKSGVSVWERYRHNPIIEPTAGTWDEDAVYKPWPLFTGEEWMLWYNGRRGNLESIGLATFSSHDLFFPPSS